MSKNIRQFIYDIVEEECLKQDEKWGDQQHPTPDWNMIFDEEKGEMAKAYIEGKRDAFIGELIQMAALMIQWLKCEIGQPHPLSKVDIERFIKKMREEE